MKCVVSVNAALGETAISFESNCHTDTLPLIKQVLFRRQPVNTASQSFALAMAILAADYCGDYFEVANLAIGSDYADAIRQVLGKHINLNPTNPMHRSLATHEVEVACGRADQIRRFTAMTADQRAVPLSTVTWSADFVDPETRTSHNNQIGTYFTNATLMTDATSVSVAVALMHGEDHAGRIYVPRPSGTLGKRHGMLVDALQAVAISLHFTA